MRQLDEKTFRFACKAIRLRLLEMVRQLNDADDLSWQSQGVLDVTDRRWTSITDLLKSFRKD